MFQEKRTSGPTPLHFAVGPKNGPPLVLLHGVCRRWRDFAPLLPVLSARWQVFAVDHRGHGGSARAARYLVSDYIADAVAFLAGLEEPAFIVGHSLGALTALGVTAATPHRVRGIVLEDPPSAAFLAGIDDGPYGVQFRCMRELAGGARPIAEVQRRMAELVLPDGSRLGERRDAAALRFLARCLADLDPQVLTPLIERGWLGEFDPVATAGQVACPALLLVGDSKLGGMLAPAEAAALATALPDCSRVDVPGVGHLIHGLRPEVFTQAVVNFLDSF